MQNESSGPQLIRFGTFELDVRAGELRKQSAKIKLQDQRLRGSWRGCSPIRANWSAARTRETVAFRQDHMKPAHR